MTTRTSLLIVSFSTLAFSAIGWTQDTESASSSVLVVQTAQETTSSDPAAEHALHRVSMFAVAAPEPRVFQRHDLVQIIVRETSRATSTHELETNKEFDMQGAITAFPDLQLSQLLQLQLQASTNPSPPRLDMNLSRDFEGEGEYERQDDLTARITAEVIEVLPNGNLVLEARTFIKTDEEEATMKVTGVCRPEDVTAANTILSNQIHDLSIDKSHRGELKKSNEKGIITQVFEALFAF